MAGAHGSTNSPTEPAVVPTPTEGHNKRKRDPDDINGGPGSHKDRIPQPPPPQSGNITSINYMSKTVPAKLQLIQSDSEAFSDVLSLIGDYEGVLSRHESLAANLGAKLTAPRLLRAVESLFEGPIAVSPQVPYKEPPTPAWYTPTWLEIASFAASNPGDFNLTITPDGRRVCQFNLKGLRVEISEDDWRLIMSGALDRFRMVPPQPLEEDEVAELATLDILEKRLKGLIKKADEVAGKARQLNYHLSGRKAAINSRRSSARGPAGPGFQASRQQPPARPGGLNLAYDLHADLLQQFSANTTQQTVQNVSRLTSIASGPTFSDFPGPPILASGAPPTSQPQGQMLTPNSRRSPAYAADSPTARESAAAGPALMVEEPPAPHLVMIQARVEKLARGDRIIPPCDRCRRLKVSCTKHLTSCNGCTRKHSKCSWKMITDEEVDQLRGEATTRRDLPGGGVETTVGPPGGPPGSGEAESGSHQHEPAEGAEAGPLGARILRARHAEIMAADYNPDKELPADRGKESTPSSSSSSSTTALPQSFRFHLPQS
ncbi:putative C6 finger domain protein [Apodospora peruviana]|uniref:C6 finger domain protein n=1 Tax=Apodospora peruviana TaxID=516989 RepID=A0AAE0ITZ5_9PEZI|nr:putative C6 finger domain protein [Apodospora peruviana]